MQAPKSTQLSPAQSPVAPLASVHDVPSGGGAEAAQPSSEHAAPPLQTLLSGSTQGEVPAWQAPLLHVSVPVQNRPSLQSLSVWH
jgi:hypothetical protein